MVRAVNPINAQGVGSWFIECIKETDLKVGNGHTVVLRKVDGLSAEKWSRLESFNVQFNQLLVSGSSTAR